MDLPVHRLFEEDRPQDAVPAEHGTGNDPGSHGVHQIEHLLVIAVRTVFEAVQPQRLGRAASALIQGGDEAGRLLDLVELFLIHDVASFRLRRESSSAFHMPANPVDMIEPVVG